MISVLKNLKEAGPQIDIALILCGFARDLLLSFLFSGRVFSVAAPIQCPSFPDFERLAAALPDVFFLRWFGNFVLVTLFPDGRSSSTAFAIFFLVIWRTPLPPFSLLP